MPGARRSVRAGRDLAVVLGRGRGRGVGSRCRAGERGAQQGAADGAGQRPTRQLLKFPWNGRAGSQLHHHLFQSKAKEKSMQDQKLAWTSSTGRRTSGTACKPGGIAFDGPAKLSNATDSDLADAATKFKETGSTPRPRCADGNGRVFRFD